MATKSINRMGGASLRHCFRAPIAPRISARCFIPRASVAATTQRPSAAIRSFHSSMAIRGLMPDAENPEPKQSEEVEQPKVPTDISSSEYDNLADQYLDELVTKLEAEAEKGLGMEVEYSAGVLEVSVTNGIYVLNKQPPNKQIWLSSPVSGPKRFDWVVMGESMHEKEGAGVGDWIYLRDGSSLTDIIRKELGIQFGAESGGSL